MGWGWRVLLSLVGIAAALVILVRANQPPPLPIVVMYRPAYPNNSLVAQFINPTNKYLAVSATFSNATLHESRTTVLNIGPAQGVEVGQQQGWQFMSGERIELSVSGYKPASYTVP
jgi:hypothetical protein